MTFFFVNIFWIFFRATTLERAWQILASMMDFSQIEWISRAFRNGIEAYGFDRDFIFAVSGLAVFIAFFLPSSFEVSQKLEQHWKVRMILTILFGIAGFICVGRVSPFLYFNF